MYRYYIILHTPAATCVTITAITNTTNYISTTVTTNSATTSNVLGTLDNGILAVVLNKKQNYDDSFVSHCFYPDSNCIADIFFPFYGTIQHVAPSFFIQ